MHDRDGEMIEPYVVTPVFCDGVGSVETDAHGLVRAMFYAEQRDAYAGRISRCVVARLIIPQNAMMTATGLIIAAQRVGAPNVEFTAGLHARRQQMT